MPTTAAGYRLFRRVARIATVACLWRRKPALEALLRWRFGDLVEAQGHLLRVDRRDRAVGARLRRRGIWSEAETALCRRDIRPGMVVLDIGANIGYFTLLFAGLVGPDGHVFACEPDPHNLRLLRANVARNRCRNVTVLPTALSRTEGAAQLYRSADNLGDHRLGHGAAGRESVQVAVTTLDTLAPHLGERIDFVKMDVQGAEAAVVAGGRELLQRGRVRMITELWPNGMRALGDDPYEFLQTLHQHGFQIAVIEPGRRLRLRRANHPADWQVLAGYGEINLYCQRDGSAEFHTA